MDLPSITEFPILTICFDFLRKQLHTNYIYTECKARILEQRIRLIVYVCYKQKSTIHLLYYCTMCWGHQTQLCRFTRPTVFRMGKWPWKDPAESFAAPLKFKQNLQSPHQKESNNPQPRTSYYLFFFLKPAGSRIATLGILTEHARFLFKCSSAKSIGCGQTTSLAV